MLFEPLLGLVPLAAGTMPVATGMLDAVVFPTGVALIQAVTIMPALVLLDGADDLAVCEGQLGVALHVFWSKGGQISRRVGMTGVSLPVLTRGLVEKEDSIDASWKGASSVLPPQRLT